MEVIAMDEPIYRFDIYSRQTGQYITTLSEECIESIGYPAEDFIITPHSDCFSE